MCQRSVYQWNTVCILENCAVRMTTRLSIDPIRAGR